MLQSGNVVAKKYRIIQRIGSGGMSTVYLAEDVHLQKKWTVKEIKKSGGKKEQMNLNSLIAEANLIKKLDHPAIPRIVDIIDTSDTVFIVRDYVDGDPMDQVLRIYGTQPQSSVIEWAKELCSILNYLHHLQPSIIYRDMKPANLMLVSDGSLRLIDFGIAREVIPGREEVRAGTKGYAAPEQIAGGRTTDARSDIYALGMTLYQLATGISPAGAGFDRAKLASDVNPQISVRFAKIIDKCIQINPEDRFQNCSELQYALEKLERSDAHENTRESVQSKAIKSVRYSCSILFFVFLILALFSGGETIIDGILGQLLSWSVSPIIQAKNVYFICAILSVCGFIGLRFYASNGKKNVESRQTLSGANVIQQAQKGSLMGMVRESLTSDWSLQTDASSSLEDIQMQSNPFSVSEGGKDEEYNLYAITSDLSMQDEKNEDVATELLDEPLDEAQSQTELIAEADEPLPEETAFYEEPADEANSPTALFDEAEELPIEETVFYEEPADEADSPTALFDEAEELPIEETAFYEEPADEADSPTALFDEAEELPIEETAFYEEPADEADSPTALFDEAEELPIEETAFYEESEDEVETELFDEAKQNDDSSVCAYGTPDTSAESEKCSIDANEDNSFRILYRELSVHSQQYIPIER